jgi:hypothetical protein
MSDNVRVIKDFEIIDIALVDTPIRPEWRILMVDRVPLTITESDDDSPGS